MNTWYSKHHLNFTSEKLSPRQGRNLVSKISSKLVLFTILFLANAIWNNVNAVTKTYSGATGNWSTIVWSPAGVPTSTDDVVIAVGTTTTVSINQNVTVASISVTGGMLMIEGGAVRAIVVSSTVSVSAGASFVVQNSSSSRTHTMSIGGDLTNNGTFNMVAASGRICNITFNKNGNQNILGSSALTLNSITVNLNSVSTNIFEVLTPITCSGALTVTSGTVKVSVATPIILGVADASIAAAGGLWNNGGTITMCNGGDLNLNGTFKNSSGTVNLGTGSGDELRYATGSSMTVDNGTVNISGGLTPSSTSAPISAITYIQNGGTVNCGTVGNTSGSRGIFDLSSTSSNFTMSGGSIVIVKPNTSFSGADYLNLANTNSGANVTGGTIQIGNTLTGSAQVLDINSTAPIYNLVVDATTNTKTARLLTSPLTVLNDVVIQTASTFNCNGLGLTVGGNFFNSGIFTAGPTTTFNSSSVGKLISGNLTGTSKFNSIVFNNSGGEWFFINSADIAANFTITSGSVVLPATLNLNVGGNWTNNGLFTDGGGTVAFNGTTVQNLSGNNATTFNNFTLNNTAAVTPGVTLNGSVDATVNGVLTFTSGVLNTNLNKIILGSTGSVSRTSGHVNGNFQKYIPAGSGVTKNFEIGDATAVKYTPVSLTFTNVSLAGNLTANTNFVDHNLTGSNFTSNKTINRYWNVTNPLSGGIEFDKYDAVFNYLAGDVDLGVNTAFVYCGKFDSGNWTYPQMGIRTATSAEIKDVTSFSDFQLGDCQAPTLSRTITDDLCNASSSGTISLTVTGGTLPLTFLWTPGGYTTQSISGLAANSYSVTVTANGGCTATTSGTVVVTSINDNNACTTDACNLANGNITHVTDPIEDDNDPCTIDGCSTLSGPTHTPATSINTQPSNTEVCEGSNAGFSIDAFGPNITFQWQDNSSGSMADISGELGSTLVVNSVTPSMTGRQYQCVINTSCGSLTSNPVTLTVDATSVGGSAGPDATVCPAANGATLTLSNKTGSVVRWEFSIDGGSSWTPISNVTIQQTYLNLIVTTLYRAVVKNGVCIEQNSSPATITVNQALSIGTQPANSTVCEGSNAGFSIVASGTGIHYQWQDNSGGGMADISGETGSSLSLSNVTNSMNGRQYQCVLTGACPSTNSNVVTLTVNPATVGGAVTNDATVCSGSNGATLTLANHFGSIVRWESSTDDGSTWTPISNITTAQSYSNLITSTKYRAVIKSGVCPEVPSSPATITVLLSTSITTQPLASSTCAESDATFTIEAIGTVLNYQWQDNSSGSFADIIGENSTTLVVHSVTLGQSGRQYRCVVTGSCPTVISNAVTLTVHAIPTASSSATLTTMCAGTSTNLSSTGTATEITNLSFNTTVSNGVLVLTSGVSSTINVSGAPTSIASLAHLSVKIIATHAVLDEVEAYLIRPGGTLSTNANGNLVNTISPGGSICLLADSGTGGNFTNTVFTDATSNFISTGTPPYTGSFKPRDAFSTLTGNPNGTWTLKMLDDVLNTNTGNFSSWSITMDFLDGSSFTWSSTPVGFTSLVQNPGNVTPLVNTIYTVTVTDTQNGCTATSSVPINVFPASVDDNNACTTDGCDPVTGPTHIVNPIEDDGSICTTDGCSSITGPTHIPLPIEDDFNACTLDGCNSTSGPTHTTLPIEDDNNPCTIDGCDPLTGPTHTIDISIIPGDGNVCTTDFCDAAGVAHHDLLPIVDDNNPCTTDGCDPVTGEFHTNVTDGSPGASDDNACTEDVCANGITAHNTLPIENDNNPCTVDACDPLNGPTHTIDASIIPGDGNECTTDYCDAAGVAHHDLLVIVDDNNPCTTDGCDPVTGEFHTNVTDGLPGSSDGNVCTSDVCSSGVTVHNTLPIEDDGNPCTVDACDPLNGPTHTIDAAIIPGDGNVCTTDYCDAAGVAHHDLLAIVDDNNPCTTDGCDPVTGEYHNNVPDGTAGTSDGSVCTSDVCSSGITVHNTLPIEDDGNPCTVDACDPLDGPTHTIDASIVPGDGNACTTDYCDAAGLAHHDLLPIVDDSNPCTTDGCDPVTGEFHNNVTDGLPGISDGSVCTDDVCINGITVHNTLSIVDDNNPCTTDGCDPVTGEFHTNVTDGLPGSSDGNACTEDVCSNGVTVHNTLSIEDDNNACTVDDCNSLTGMIHTQVNIDDGDATTIDYCNTLTGDIIHTQIDIDDGDVCTIDASNTITGQVTHTPVNTDDGNPCTIDGCNSITGPTHTIDETIIPDDGNVCTTDYCDAAGDAHHDLLAIVDDNNPCTTDGCDPLSGEFHTNVTDGLPGTTDGSVCTEDVCSSGVTVHNTLPIDDDNNPCTVDACDPLNGPTHTIDISIVPGDGNVCTTDYCDATGVAHHDLLAIVDDFNPCTTDGCDPVNGEYHTAVTDGLPGTSDGSVCTEDVCSSGVTVHNTLPIEDDNNPCTVDACDPLNGPTHTIDISIIPGDGNVCTTDYCDIAGVAHHDLLAIVDDNNPCTTDGCDPVTGEYHTAVSDGLPGTSDGSVCTDDVCSSGVTVHNTLPIEDDNNPCTVDACDPLVGPTHTIDISIVPGDGNVCTADYCDTDGQSHHDLLAIVDDNNPCTIDGCNSITGEFHTPVTDGLPGASDGTVCTEDVCAGGITIHNTLPIEDDNNVCTVDGCDPVTGPTHTPDVSIVPGDGNVCTTDYCDTDGQSHHDLLAIVDDNNPCTIDGCNSITGEFHTPVTDGLPGTSDGTVCTEDVCVGGVTVHNTLPIEDDNNVCTVDGCDPVTGPTHTPDISIVPGDGNVCTTDYCDTDGQSHHDLLAIVDDNNPCTTDGCNSITGEFHTPVTDGLPGTSDGTVCTEDVCAGGVTIHNTLPIEDDNNVCTVDGCDPVTGPTHTPDVSIVPGDGNVCTTDYCDTDGQSHHDLLSIVDDNNPCTTDGCDPLAGEYHTAVTDGLPGSSDGTVCTEDVCSSGVTVHNVLPIEDDNNICTVDGCNSLTGPTHTIDISIIPDDGNVCTTDYCDASGIAHNDLLAIVDDVNPCTTDGCNSITGEFHTPVTDGLPGTSDGTVCTSDICINGQTVHNTLPIENDFNVCTTDGCNSITGPTHVLNPIVNDNNVCTVDGCNSITGVFHNPVNKNDGNPCTIDVCDVVLGVFHLPVNTSDGSLCTNDACNSTTGIISHTNVNIEDNNVCTNDGCNSLTGVFHTAVNKDDNNLCTIDACDRVLGVYHIPVKTTDLNACTIDACDPSTGIISHVGVNVFDGDACTVDICNPANGFIQHIPVVTDDNNSCTIDGCDIIDGVYHVPVDIDDNNACTADACNSVIGITHTTNPIEDDLNVCTTDGCNPVTGPTHDINPIQDDGNACTVDGCDPITGPTHITITNVDDANACTIDGCNSATGIFHNPISVNDFNACTIDGCDIITGVSHSPVNPTDNNACTIDACITTSGLFTHTPISADDNNVCTTDACNTLTGAVTNIQISITDNNGCTTDACDPVTGVSHTAINPTDNNACTVDACITSTGLFTHTPVNTSDNNVCTTDACNTLTGAITNTLINTDDNNFCTTDACDPVTGVSHTAINPTDNNACTIDACITSTGLFTHTPVNPSDNNVCTTDACNTLTGAITNTQISTTDNNACTTDACDPVTGVSHTAINPTDNNACTVDACITSTGLFTHTPVNTSDNNVCTTDACNTLTGAITNTPISTTDNNACTTDACDPVTGVSHTAINPTDNNACTIDACITSTGLFTHTPVNTNDNNVCTTDACNTISGAITNTPISTTDNNACTTDACDPVTGVSHTAINPTDNNACTVDACITSTGLFTHTPVNTSDNNVCTTDACNTLTGAITNTQINTNDNNACTTDACDPVNGVSHTAINPTDNNACTIDACITSTGLFTHTPVNSNDGNVCTTDACNTLTGAITNTQINTNDNNACTTDACDPVTGVSHTAVNPTDNNACTIDACITSSGLFTHTPVNTNDNNVCTTDACNSLTGAITNTPISTDDNNACTTDGCDPVTGAFHNPVSVDDANACTTDGCNPVSGVFHNPVNTNDNNSCTTDGCSPASGVFHNPVNTNDNNPCTLDGCNSSSGIFHTDITPTAPSVAVVNSCASSVLTAGNFIGSLLWNTGATTTSITVLVAGPYSVTQTVSGCTSPAGSGSALFGGSAPPVPGTILGPAGACRSQSNVVFSIVPVAGAASYIWTLPTGGSGSSTGSSITVSFSTAFVTSNISVRSVNACGQSLNSTRSVTQYTVAPAVPGAISGSATLCPSASTIYSVAAVPNTTTYSWTPTGGLTIVSGQGSNTILVSAPAGFVTGNLTVSASNCVSTSGTSTLLIKGLPSLPVWKTAPPAYACGGSCYLFNIDNVQDAINWTFTAPPGGTITSSIDPVPVNSLTTTKTNVTICFPAAFTSGNILIYSTNACGNSATLIYTIGSKPPTPGPITGSGSVCKNQILPYSVPAVPTATGYAWTVSGGATISTGQGTRSVNVSYKTATLTNVTLSVTASNSCGASVAATIPVAVNLNCKNAGGNLADDAESITALSAFPNPVTDKTTITFISEKNIDYVIKLSDMIGQVILSERISAVVGYNEKEINLENIAKGLYLISVQTEEGENKSLRLIVE